MGAVRTHLWNITDRVKLVRTRRDTRRTEGTAVRMKEIVVMSILKKLAVAMVPVVAMSLWTGSASAQQNCTTRDNAVSQLAKQYKEQVVSRGLIKGGKTMVELFVSDTGSWTMVVTNTDGTSCVVAAGDSWHDVPAVSPVVKKDA